MTKTDSVRNEGIRESMGVTNIGVKYRRAILRWLGRVKRREEDYVGRRMLSMVPAGMREKLLPKQRWMDTINADMRSVGVREEDTQERKIWKTFLSAIATHTKWEKLEEEEEEEDR